MNWIGEEIYEEAATWTECDFLLLSMQLCAYMTHWLCYEEAEMQFPSYQWNRALIDRSSNLISWLYNV